MAAAIGSDEPRPSTTQATRLFETAEMDKTLLVSLCAAVGEGKRADGGFRRATWEKALCSLRHAYPDTSFEQYPLKFKVDALKEKYCELQQCFNTSGFRRNLEKNLPTVSPQVWEEYLTVCFYSADINQFFSDTYIGTSTGQRIP
jgi:hypothetical protein